MSKTSDRPLRAASTTDAPIRGQLAHEHEQLDRALGEILAVADGGQASELRAAWGKLERLLLRHLAFEEEELFPRLESAHPDWTRGFREEHARIRHLLAELGLRIDLHALRKSEIDELVTLLRTHAEREDATMYRWADEGPPVDTRRHLLRLLVTTATAARDAP